jgi:hypothetical protein
MFLLLNLLSSFLSTSRLSDLINVLIASSVAETGEKEWQFTAISSQKSGSM